MVGLVADLDETGQSVILHELVHEVLVLLRKPMTIKKSNLSVSTKLIVGGARILVRGKFSPLSGFGEVSDGKFECADGESRRRYGARARRRVSQSDLAQERESFWRRLGERNSDASSVSALQFVSRFPQISKPPRDARAPGSDGISYITGREITRIMENLQSLIEISISPVAERRAEITLPLYLNGQ